MKGKKRERERETRDVFVFRGEAALTYLIEHAQFATCVLNWKPDALRPPRQSSMLHPLQSLTVFLFIVAFTKPFT